MPYRSRTKRVARDERSMPWLVRSLSAGSKQTELRTFGWEVALQPIGFLSIQSGTCLLTVRGVDKWDVP